MTNELATTTQQITGFINTVGVESDDAKMASFNAINNAQSLASIPAGTVLNVHDVITMPGIRKGRNGAPDHQCQNNYLLVTNDDGTETAYFTQSVGISRDINTLAVMYPDFSAFGNDYLNLAVVENPLADGRTVKSLVMTK